MATKRKKHAVQQEVVNADPKDQADAATEEEAVAVVKEEKVVDAVKEERVEEKEETVGVEVEVETAGSNFYNSSRSYFRKIDLPSQPFFLNPVYRLKTGRIKTLK
jgi:hypothetical protein